nr:hypothetical protein [Piscinibacter sp.]
MREGLRRYSARARDVAGRVAQPEVGGQARRDLLGDHRAAAVGGEAIDHHPVVARQLGDAAGGGGGQFADLVAVGQLLRAVAQADDVAQGVFVAGRLGLDHEQAAAVVDGHVDRVGAPGPGDAVQMLSSVVGERDSGVCGGGGQGLARQGRLGTRTQQRARRVADPGGGIGRDVRDVAARIDGQKKAGRLDAAEPVDGFGGAFRQRALQRGRFAAHILLRQRQTSSWCR